MVLDFIFHFYLIITLIVWEANFDWESPNIQKWQIKTAQQKGSALILKQDLSIQFSFEIGFFEWVWFADRLM